MMKISTLVLLLVVCGEVSAVHKYIWLNHMSIVLLLAEWRPKWANK